MSRAESDLLSIVIITGVVLVCGFILWGFFSGYASVTRLSAQEEVNKELEVLRSSISADYVICPRGEAWIRNTGKESLIVFRVIVFKNGEAIWDSFRVHGIKALSEIDVGDISNPPIRFTCPSYSEDDIVTVQVHYIPKSLFNPSSPELIEPTPDVQLFRIATFEVEEESEVLGGRCDDIPKNWAWIDYIDPEDSPPNGQLGQRIGVRIPEASSVLSINLEVEVEDSAGRKVLGSGSVVTNLEENQWISIDLSSLRYPVIIKFKTVFPENSKILQTDWYLNAIENSYVNYIKLFWNALDGRATGAYVSVFHKISGTYRITVKAIDCYGVVAKGSSQDRDVVIGAAGRWEEYPIVFDNSLPMLNIRRIEVYVEDVSPFVTLTETTTVLTTETITETLTSYTTQPAGTLTLTVTQIITKTTSIPATTSTNTILTTSIKTTSTTTTSTSTRTSIGSTLLITTYTTVTSTSTTYLSTVTVTRTTTSKTTTTRYSTSLVTSTASIPTATATVTSTIASTTNIPTNTITYTTTATSITTYTPPPATATTTVKSTSTVATKTSTVTATTGTTITTFSTVTSTVNVCPSTGSSSTIHFSTDNVMLALAFLILTYSGSMIVRRRRP